jgi:hypothetical protein
LGGTDIFIDRIYDCSTNTADKTDENYGLSISPNPVNENVIIKISYPLQNNTLIYFYDVQGKILFQSVMSSSPMQLNLKDISAGIYIVKVIMGRNVAIAKLIKSQ